MTKAKFLANLTPSKDLYLDASPFNKQIITFQNTGIKYLISVRDDAYARLKDKDKGGTRTCHAPILAKNSPVIIAKISPLVINIEMAKQAVQAHKRGEYPIFDRNIYDKWYGIVEKDKDKKPENRRAIILPERGDYRAHRDSDEARFFFKDTREKYFDDILQKDTIQTWQVNPETVDSQDGTIMNYVWFHSVDYGSGLYLRDRGLGYVDRALGVLRKTSEAGSRRKKLPKSPYTQRQLNTQIRRADRIVQGKVKISDLESEVKQLKEFLETLKQ